MAAQGPGHVGLTYYTAKVFVSTLVLGTVGGSAAIMRMPTTRRGLSTAAVILGGAIVSTATVGTYPVRAYHYAQQIAPALDRVLTPTQPGTERWVLDGCDPWMDYVATKWANDLELTWTPGRHQALDEFIDQEGVNLAPVTSRLDDSQVDVLEVVLHQPCQRERVAELAEFPKVRVTRVP